MEQKQALCSGFCHCSGGLCGAGCIICVVFPEYFYDSQDIQRGCSIVLYGVCNYAVYLASVHGKLYGDYMQEVDQGSGSDSVDCFDRDDHGISSNGHCMGI